MEHTESTTAPNPMNQDVFAGRWKQMRGTVKSWWGKLTDDDFDRIAGQKDKLIGTLQDKYGYTQDMAQREIEQRMHDYSGETAKASAATTTVGEKMTSLAGAIRDNTPAQGTLGSAANAVANQLDTAGSYLQTANWENMAKDLSDVIRRYPLQSLLVGVGIGYLMARNSER
jgi:uncharacterized protein YjbJ (UPF0337 family)